MNESGGLTLTKPPHFIAVFIADGQWKIGDKNKTAKRQLIIEYLTDHPDAKSAEIAEYIDLKPSRVRDYLLELIKENIVITSGGNRNRTYRLKS